MIINNNCQAQVQVQVRCRSGSGQGKRKKLKDMDLSYTLNLVYTYSHLLIAYSRLLHTHKLYMLLPLAPYSPVKLFSHLLNTPHSNFSAACSTLPTQIFQPLAPNSGMTSKWALSIEPLAPYSPVKLFSRLLNTSHSNFSALNQGLYRDVKTSSDKELKFRMRFNQSQILVVQYVNSRQHTGK